MKQKLISLFAIVFIIAIIFTGFYYNSSNTESPADKRVKVFINSQQDIQRLSDYGITVDEYFGNKKTEIILEMNYDEFIKLKSTGFRYEVLIDNLKEYYDNQPPMTSAEIQNNKDIMKSDGITGYTLGTMGGFHKYTEIISVLDSLRLLFPTLISAKQNLGNSYENRTLYAVKISDNPDVNESATEPAVYFDGIHHAREPMSMEVQLYYMWYLLENYATNPEVQQLVNTREIFFVPIVNPDGYVYNQTTNPNGGGSWRKSRGVNPGSSCLGTDLNRNYNVGWGVGSGSSSDPCSDTYRGSAPGSEPETQRIKAFLQTKHPKIGMSLHSAAGYNLNPYSYVNQVVAYEMYQDFSSEFGVTNQFLYGNVWEMLSYYSAGTTRDYMHDSVGTYAWTSEMEGSSFWPSSSNIIPMCSRFLPTMKLVTYFGGAYAKLQSFTVAGKGWASKNDTLQLQLTIRNKGLGLTSKNVVAEVTSTYSGLTTLVGTVNYDSIQARQTKTNTTNPFKFKIPNTASIADNMMFVAKVKQENVVVSTDTFYVTVGKVETLFSDDAENGKSNWTSTSNKLHWDTTFASCWKGTRSFADSRYGNTQNSTTSQFTLNNQINLSGKINPRLEYAIKFATETGYDYVRIQISSNNGSTWTSVAGRYTTTFSSQPTYIGLKYWVYEQVNLAPYIGQNIKVRFYLYTDSGQPGDGVYIDDIRIVEYKDAATGITQSGNEIPATFALEQNYPNPFNPSTTIKFQIPAEQFVSLKIFDLTGREVASLINEKVNPGYYEVVWNAVNFSSGVYFYKLSAGTFEDTKRMLLVK
jgi:hypothetical protein